MTKPNRSTHRRLDVIYFGLILTGVAIGIFLSNAEPEEGVALELPEFRPPELEFEAPFDFPYTIVRFKDREVPRLVLAGNTESVLVEVRSALLESSSASEVEVAIERPVRRLASLRD